MCILVRVPTKLFTEFFLATQSMRAGIDVHALEQDVEAALRLQHLTQQLSHEEACLNR